MTYMMPLGVSPTDETRLPRNEWHDASTTTLLAEFLRDRPCFDLDQIGAPERHDERIAGGTMGRIGEMFVPRLVHRAAVGIAHQIDRELHHISQVHSSGGEHAFQVFETENGLRLRITRHMAGFRVFSHDARGHQDGTDAAGCWDRRSMVGKAGDFDAFLSHAFSNYAQRAKARPVPVSAGVR